MGLFVIGSCICMSLLWSLFSSAKNLMLETLTHTLWSRQLMQVSVTTLRMNVLQVSVAKLKLLAYTENRGGSLQ